MRELTIQAPGELFNPVKKLLANLRGTRILSTRKLAEAAPPAAPPFTPEQQQLMDELKESLREAAAFEPSPPKTRAKRRSPRHHLGKAGRAKCCCCWPCMTKATAPT